MKPDVRVEGHGSVALVRPMTVIAKEWIDGNVTLESWQWFGGAVAVDPRYLDDLLMGMMGDGLRIEQDGRHYDN